VTSSWFFVSTLSVSCFMLRAQYRTEADRIVLTLACKFYGHKYANASVPILEL